MILTILTFLFQHTPPFVLQERSQDLSQESVMHRLINTDKTLCLIIYSVVYKLTCCSRSNRERREGLLFCSCWLLTGRGIFSTGMRNLVNIIDGTPDVPGMNKHQYHKIDNFNFKFKLEFQRIRTLCALNNCTLSAVAAWCSALHMPVYLSSVSRLVLLLRLSLKFHPLHTCTNNSV